MRADRPRVGERALRYPARSSQIGRSVYSPRGGEREHAAVVGRLASGGDHLVRVRRDAHHAAHHRIQRRGAAEVVIRNDERRARAQGFEMGGDVLGRLDLDVHGGGSVRDGRLEQADLLLDAAVEAALVLVPPNGRQAAPARYRKAEGRDALVRAVRAFIRMYRPHEAREDTVLFPAMGKLLLLKTEPNFTGVLPMYVLFLLLAIPAVYCLQRGWWPAVVGGSCLIYLAGKGLGGYRFADWGGSFDPTVLGYLVRAGYDGSLVGSLGGPSPTERAPGSCDLVRACSDIAVDHQ